MCFERQTQKRISIVAMLMVLVFYSESFQANDLRPPQRRREQRYELTGIVKAVDKPRRRATIKHEKVAGLMNGMTMPFLIKDDKALSELQVGDQIKATLVSTDDGAQWLEKVTIVAKAQFQNRAAESNPEPNFDDKPFWLMGSSGNDRKPPPSRFDGDATGLYTCSMHLNYRANKPGKCPRCGMTLISTEPGIAEEFNLEMEASPVMPQPGQPLKLQFAIFNPRTGAQVEEFGLMHDKLFHLFLVSQDMSDFQHIHPRQLPDGSFVIETLLQHAGLYKVYADFYPLDGAPQMLQTNLATAGWAGDVMGGQARLTPDTNLTKIVTGLLITSANAERAGVEPRALEAKPAGALKAQLSFERTPILSGQKVSLKYQLTDAQSGQPVRDLIPYLGAWGHMLILSEDQTEPVHSHPEQQVDFEQDIAKQRGGPEVTFDVLFPAPGNYRVWAQFLRGRQLFTVAFDVYVERIH